MRIAQITPYFHPHVGGVESHVRDLSRKLTELGHEVEVITSMFEPGLLETEKIDNFIIHRLPTLAIIAKTPILRSMKKFLMTRDFDVIHAHSPPPLACFSSAKCARKKGIPFVYTHHCDMEIPMRGGKYIVSLYCYLFERKTIRWSDALICTTHSYAATSRSTWDRDVDVIPNAVDVGFFRPDIDGSMIRKRHGLEDKTVVMFVGRIVHHKGIESLIMSARHTKEPIHYLVVGPGEDRERLERMASELDKERVTFTGPVPRKELPEYYAAADMLVLPSLSRLEAFGIVGLEALASGKPIILSRMPGLREVITPGVEGVYFEPSDAADLGRGIMGLHSSPELRERMGKKGRERVLRDYSMTKVAKEVEKVYQRV
ncbi:MAG: glycosyltransferase family 4 protein, partial [Thermoplasmata archaeon]|nr:glycosyltransferase family 4 protein [Thermoplasmata archaeon]